MNGKVKKILITVKAYPHPSKRYGETVCVAGINVDNGKWTRLYPVTYRDLEENKKFKKYNIIEAKVVKAKKDNRPESFNIDADSIKIVDYFDTGRDRKWAKRKEVVLPTVDKSMCEISKQQELNKKSLGVFKPREVDFIYKKASPKDMEARKACYAQLSFFNRRKNDIEPIPFEFRYKFFCEGEPSCPGHNHQIIDWEIGEAYRDWRRKYPTQEVLLEKIRERWLDGMCSAAKDVYFFTGNMFLYPKIFLILGSFYPPK